jgi:hypothetical protein
METAEVLVILLDIWHGKPCPAPLDTDTMWLLLKVINLAKKYDCPAATYTMSKAYNACLNEGVSPRTCFILLAMLDDLPGCAVAIRRAGRWRWADHSETSLRSSIVGASVFDVTSWDIETYTTVPQAYSLALLRAAKKVAMPLGDKTDWKVVADEFTRLMKDGEPTSSRSAGGSARFADIASPGVTPT